MGLAPYGAPDFAGALSRVLRLLPGGGFALDLSYFRHASGGIRMTWDDGAPAIDPVFLPKLEDLLGPARHPAEPLTSRHEAIAASLQSVFERAVFHVLRGLSRADAAAAALPGGRLRHEQRRQRQDPRGDAVSGGVRPARRRRRWDGPRGRLSRVERGSRGGSRRFVMDHAYWGPAFGPAAVRRALDALRPELARQGMQVTESRRRRGALPLHGRASRRGPDRGLVPGPDGVGGTGPRQPEHPRRSPAGGHARDHQCEDQAPRGVPAVRPLHPRGGARRVLRRSRQPTRS